MRKTILSLMVSLDGYYVGPGNGFEQIDWHMVDHEWDEFAVELLGRADMLLFGRRTFTEFSGFWPSQSGPIADGLRDTHKTVYSKTLSEAGWVNARLARDPIDDVKRLKKLPGKDMVIFGSGTLARALLDADLLDEVRLAINPVALGSGKTFLPEDGMRRHFAHKDTHSFTNGVVMLTLEPAR